jgi:hypothetical protein
VWVENVNPSHFFVNAFTDPRGWDIELVGMTHSMSIAEVIMRFSGGDHAKANALRQIYSQDDLHQGSAFFKTTNDRCRVIEVWTLECEESLLCHDEHYGEIFMTDLAHRALLDQENTLRKKNKVTEIDSRWHINTYWQCRYLAPDGTLLDSFISPFNTHPFVVKLYPLIDGEVHPFVEDVIDQQRYINRMITMLDFIMGSSAKGVLLFPEDQIPEGMTIDELAEEWTRYNGIIMYRPRPGSPSPQQVSINATNVGAYDMLSMQMRMFDNISGVHGAIQGKSAPSGTPYALYVQQMQNSSLNLVDLFESFKCFRVDRDTKLLKTIQQFYDMERYKKIVGEDSLGVLEQVTEEEVKDVELDITITESVSSPVYRIASNEFLLDLFKMGQIDLKMLLENGSFPFADKLLQSLK